MVVGAFVCQTGLGYSYVFGTIAEDVMREMGWSRTEYASAISTRVWATAFAHPLLGWLTVRYGARPVLVGGVVLLGVSMAGMSRIDALWELVAWSVLLGMVQVALGDAVAGQAVAVWVRRWRGLALGLVYAGSNVGARVVLVAAAQLSEESWRTALLWLGLIGTLSLMPFAAFAIRAPRATEGADDVEDGEGPGVELGEALRTRSFWLLGFALAVYFAYFVAVLDHVQLMLRDAGVSKLDAAWYYATAVFMGLFSKPIFGLTSDFMPPRTAAVVNTLLYAGTAFLMPALPHPVLIWVWIIVYGWTSTAREVIYPLLIVHGFGVRNMAAIYGALTLALLVGPVGSIVAAAIRESTGSYDTAFILFGALNLLAAGAVALVRHERPAPGS